MGDSVDISDFLASDITGKLVTNFSYTDLDKDEIVKFYKVTPRAQVRTMIKNSTSIKQTRSQLKNIIVLFPTAAVQVILIYLR